MGADSPRARELVVSRADSSDRNTLLGKARLVGELVALRNLNRAVQHKDAPVVRRVEHLSTAIRRQMSRLRRARLAQVRGLLRRRTRTSWKSDFPL